MALCRSKVLQNAPREHSAILSTFIKLSFVVKTFVLSISSGRLRKVLLFIENNAILYEGHFGIHRTSLSHAVH